MRIDLQPNEQIIRSAVKHWWYMCTKGAAILGLFFLALVAVELVSGFAEGAHLPFPSEPVVAFALAFFALILWMAFFTFWTDYYLDAYYVTTERIIYVEQKSFFNREISSFRIDRIQDIAADTPGFIATMLRFGDVRITTASALQPFVMRTVPNPEELKNLIIGYIPVHSRQQNCNEIDSTNI